MFLLVSFLCFLTAGCDSQPPAPDLEEPNFEEPNFEEPNFEEPEPQEEQDPPGFYVEGRHLYNPCGEKVVLRGINKMVVWQDRDGKPAFEEIAKTGANAVRIVWTTEAPPGQLGEAISNAIDAGLLPIIELHDATGEWDKLGAMVDYWTRPATVEVIQEHEERLLVNVANEAGDHSVTDAQFKEGYAEALRRMRSAGIRTPIVIDAAGWGRDAEQLLRTGAWLAEQDPAGNVMFSVHWWHSDGDKGRITHALEEAARQDLPLMVGEFAHAEVGCKGEIAYRHLIAEAERLGIGWLAWSWGPGNADCAEMDMTEDGTFETLHGWGREVAVTDPNSIQNTSAPALPRAACDAGSSSSAAAATGGRSK